MLGNPISYRRSKTDLTVADILREHWDEYRSQYPVSPQQAKVAGSMMACRTPQLGGRLDQCRECGAWVFRFNSCRDRHCHQCQKFERAQWVEKQKVMWLPIPYFHVVFTSDHGLNPLFRHNQRRMYDLLFKTASQVLQQQARTELGCELGITAVLHSWGQQLDEHVHLHCLVTGGGLALEGRKWVRPASRRYLVDVVEVSARYRDKLCQGVRRLYRQGQLKGVGQAAEVKVERLLAELETKGWEVFIKAFSQPDTVYEYLSRYEQQVAISNYRLLKLKRGWVTFHYYDNRARTEVGLKGPLKELRLAAVEFIRRLLLHVLPVGFKRIRYYGLHHPKARPQKLPRCRELLGLPRALPAVRALLLLEWLKEILGDQADGCPQCGAQGSLVYRREFGRLPWLVLVLVSLVGRPTVQGVSY